MKRLFISALFIAGFFACQKSGTKEMEPIRMFTTDDTWSSAKINSYSVLKLPDGSGKINQIESAEQAVFDRNTSISVSPEHSATQSFEVQSGGISFRITGKKYSGQLILHMNGKSTDLMVQKNFQALNEKEKAMVAYTLILVNDYKTSGTGIIRKDHSKNNPDSKNLRLPASCSQTFINIGNTREQATYLNTIEMSSWSNAHISTHEYLSHTCGSTCISGDVGCVSICTVYYACSN